MLDWLEPVITVGVRMGLILGVAFLLAIRVRPLCLRY